MKLSYSTWGMQTTPIDEAVRHCAALGFDGLELTIVPGWPTDAATMSASERTRIRQLYDDAGLELCGLSGNVALLQDDPRAEAADEARFRSYLDFAAEIQKPGEQLIVTTVSGGGPGDWDARKHEFVQTAGRLATYANDAGVMVGIEPHAAHALRTPDDAIWLVEQVGSPALTIHFDISHFNVQGIPMAESVEKLTPISLHTHVKDERGIFPDHEFLIPGEGEMNYPRYLGLMSEAGYDGHIVIEISLMVQRRPDYDALAAATQSYDVLSRAFDTGGHCPERTMTDHPARDLDVIALGSIMAEISPPDNRTRVTEADSLVMVQAGSATTFALAFQKLGGKLGFISRLGQDEVGEWIRRSLEAEGVDTSEVRAVPGQLTPISLASVAPDGKKTFAYYRFPGYSEPLGTMRSEDVSDDYLSRAAIFDLTESSLRSIDSREVGLELARRCRALGVKVCVNPNYRPTAWKGGQTEAVRVLKEAMSFADLAIMNGEEASLISGENEFDRAISWLAANGPALVAVTHGELPAALIVDGKVSDVPAVPATVVFDIGAGDTFHAAFLAHYTAGNDPETSGRFAAQAAALKIQRPPLIDQLPTRAEVLAALGQ